MVLRLGFGDAKEITKFDPTAKIYIFDRFAALLKQVNPIIVLDGSCGIITNCRMIIGF